MPVTITYDLQNAGTSSTYIRSMLERFNWKRLGGSVFRYSGRDVNGILEEDWLNDVVPALMFFRSYILNNNIVLTRFTLDTNSIAFLDQSDPLAIFGNIPFTGPTLNLVPPTNHQSSEQAIRQFVDSSTASTP